MASSSVSAELLIPLAEQRLARAALKRLDKPSAVGRGRLLYLVGPAGCGKSMLIREFAASQSEVAVITASEFAAQLAEDSDARKWSDFQERFRGQPIFICEDVHSLSGRVQTLQQLLAIVDELLAHGRDIVFSSTRLPGQLEEFPVKLVNRFRGGTILNIKFPGPESRASLLRHIVQREQLSMARDALALLAESIEVSPRELLGIVRQLKRTSNTTTTERARFIKRTDVEQFLQDADRNPTRTIRPADVSRAVASEFGVTMASLRSTSRSAALMLPRQCAMWLCRRLCGLSYPQIGTFFDREHSSVLHAVRRFELRLQEAPQIRQQIARIETTIQQKPCRPKVD